MDEESVAPGDERMRAGDEKRMRRDGGGGAGMVRGQEVVS